MVTLESIHRITIINSISGNFDQQEVLALYHTFYLSNTVSVYHCNNYYYCICWLCGRRLVWWTGFSKQNQMNNHHSVSGERPLPDAVYKTFEGVNASASIRKGPPRSKLRVDFKCIIKTVYTCIIIISTYISLLLSTCTCMHGCRKVLHVVAVVVGSIPIWLLNFTMLVFHDPYSPHSLCLPISVCVYWHRALWLTLLPTPSHWEQTLHGYYCH